MRPVEVDAVDAVTHRAEQDLRVASHPAQVRGLLTDAALQPVSQRGVVAGEQRLPGPGRQHQQQPQHGLGAGQHLVLGVDELDHEGREQDAEDQDRAADAGVRLLARLALAAPTPRGARSSPRRAGSPRSSPGPAAYRTGSRPSPPRPRRPCRPPRRTGTRARSRVEATVALAAHDAAAARPSRARRRGAAGATWSPAQRRCRRRPRGSASRRRSRRSRARRSPSPARREA